MAARQQHPQDIDLYVAHASTDVLGIRGIYHNYCAVVKCRIETGLACLVSTKPKKTMVKCAHLTDRVGVPRESVIITEVGNVW